MNSNPNIFDCGTSELSNKTVIFWMLKWAEVKDSILYDLAKDLIQLFIEDYSKNIEIKNIELYKDFIYEKSIYRKHIDILIKLNDKYIIIIGDNAESVVDANLTNDYRHILEKDEIFEDKIVIYIHLKIGEESTFKLIEKNGYKIIKRKHLIDIIEKNKNISNEILKDYYNYLCKTDNEFNSYKNIKLINNWPSRAWQGLYSKLQEEKNIEIDCWHYVSRIGGGYWLFTWDINQLKYNSEINYSIYLQLEAKNNKPRITFKLKVDNSQYQSEIRDFIWRKLKKIINSKSNEKYIPKKTTFQRGKRMFIAQIYNIETEVDLKKAMNVAENYYLDFIEVLKNS
jgi:hypothetical protein